MPKLNDYIKMLEPDFSGHPHFAITKRVFECLDYIDANIDKIASYAGKGNLLRHPTNHLVFHLTGLNTPASVKRNFLGLISELKGYVAQLLQTPNNELKHSLINSFLLNINDSNLGCMEARVRPALNFFLQYQMNGCMHINDLMKQFEAASTGSFDVGIALDIFAHKIEHRLPVKTITGETKPLSWEMIHTYLSETLNISDIKQRWLVYSGTTNQLVTYVTYPDKHWQHYYFYDANAAQLYLSYIKSLLPAHLNELKKASITHDAKNNSYTFKLTTDQQKTFDKVKRSTGPTAPVATPSIETKNTHNDDRLIKAVRFDPSCFIFEFIHGIVPIPGSPVKIKKLRPGNHKNYTVYGQGVFRRDEGFSPYGDYTKDELQKMKAVRSQPQSTSFYSNSKEILPPLFGHNKKR